MAVNDYNKRWKEQKQAVIKHRAKIYTEALYFALNIGVNSTSKEWNEIRGW